MKVAIVGLPLFAERLAQGLTNYDPHNKYVAFDTYYNRWDKIKALLMIPRYDLVYSINGTTTRSRLFDLAFKRKIPVIMNWVGTDVLKAIDSAKNGNAIQAYIDNATHYCEVQWIKDELAEIGIQPEIVNFASFDKKFDLVLPENELTVLTYISDGRPAFYGIESIIALAKEFSSVRFLIAGTKAEKYEPLPENVKALGWVDNMGELFDQSHVCIRFPEHDGLSNFILEALARGKEVLYRYPFENCRYCPDYDKLESEMRAIAESYKKGDLKVNSRGADFIAQEFSSDVILKGLINRFKQLSGR